MISLSEAAYRCSINHLASSCAVCFFCTFWIIRSISAIILVSWITHLSFGIFLTVKFYNLCTWCYNLFFIHVKRLLCVCAEIHYYESVAVHVQVLLWFPLVSDGVAHSANNIMGAVNCLWYLSCPYLTLSMFSFFALLSQSTFTNKD